MGNIRSMPLRVVTEHVRSIVDKVKVDIADWIKRITLKRKELGGYSICPFALTATFHIEECDLSDVRPIDGVDVAIFVVGDIELFEMLECCERLNREYREYLFLDDHISETTYLNGVQTNFGKGNLILAQRREKLLDARQILKKTEYYEYWSEEMYNRIVEG